MSSLPIFRAAPVLLLLLSPLGCGDDDPAAATSGNPPGAGGNGGGTSTGGQGGTGGALDCPAGTHAGAGVCEATLTGWVDAAPLAQRRDHHITFVVDSEAGPFLYAAAGIEDNTVDLDTSEMAAIQPDGSLGAWTAGVSLPASAGGPGVAVVGSTVVVTGGFRYTDTNQPYLSDETDVTTVQPDGSLGAWTVGPSFGPTRFHHAMATHGANIYVIGGLTGNNTDNTTNVERATVGEGTVSAWVATTALPGKRSHHSVATHGDALYLTGGLTGNPAGAHETFSDVLRAPINEDGSLGEWATVGQLPTTLTTHASFVHADHLYVLGGIEGGHMNVAAVRRAPIGADGMVGAWEELPALPQPRAHAHHAPMYAGVAYAVGGALNHVSIADVFIGRFE